MPSEADPRILYIDYTKCIGCETCESVCKFLYTVPRIVMVRTHAGEMAPLYCRHCSNPMCVKACKPGALSVDSDGRVLLNPMLCRGCETMACVPACPFGGIYATGEGVGVIKCDLCAERRKQGMFPACLEMCPCGAIRYLDRESIRQLQDNDEAREAQKRVLAHLSPAKAR
jgi:Fe-S-cluster-containing dehydrogenase component